MNKIIDFFHSPLKIFLFFNNRNIKILSDKTYLKLKYKLVFNKKLNLKNPQTFNEKIQWLKLYDRKDIHTTMADKYESKKYVASIIGEEYIIQTLGIYDKFDDIDFSKLPNQFVIKCTHDSGGIVICHDKSSLNIEEARKKINKALKYNYYIAGREWQYKNIKPRIIIEKYMQDSIDNDLKDYKFFCFNGKVKFFKIDFDRFIKHKANYYDLNENILPFGEEICPPDFNRKLKMPNNLKTMIELAEKLSKGIKFVRVDFYEVDNKIYFGELTFCPASGFGKFNPDEWDLKLGKMIDLKGE